MERAFNHDYSHIQSFDGVKIGTHDEREVRYHPSRPESTEIRVEPSGYPPTNVQYSNGSAFYLPDITQNENMQFPRQGYTADHQINPYAKDMHSQRENYQG